MIPTHTAAPGLAPTALDASALDARADFCRDLLASAAAIALEGFEAMAAGEPADMVEMKGPQDFLTQYDGMVEEHIRGRIAEAFPQDGFLGEETGRSGGDTPARLWVVDPIDGTANFARAIPHFAVSIAFLDAGSIEIGGLAAPALGETHFARKGFGATRNGKPIRAAATSRLDRASVEFGWSPRIGNDVYLERLTRLLDLGINVRRGASGALGLAYVADGRSDAYAEMHINAWDCLAGIVLASEAGALTNDFLANDGLWSGNPILAASPGIAAAISGALDIPLG